MQTEWFNQATRKILVDYHTPEFIENATKDFNAKEWIRMFKQSGANGGIFFSKCHHGNSYYETKIGHKHERLKGDMLGDIVKEARKENIRIFVYHSVCWDKRAASKCPDWVQRKPDGTPIRYRIWDYLCLNSPYTDELVIPQLEEIARNYDIDALWLDIVYQHREGCYCRYCREKYQNLYGKEMPNDPSLLKDFRMRSTIDFLKEVNTCVKKIKPLMVGLNDILYFPPFIEEPDFWIMRQLSKNTDYFSVEARCESTVKEESFASLDPLCKVKLNQLLGKPFDIITSAYIHSWGAWDIVPKETLQRIYAQALTGSGVAYIGLQAYPQGILDAAAMKTISEAFKLVKDREEWSMNAESVPDIALMGSKFDRSFKGAFQILTESHLHFDLIDEEAVDDLGKYQVLVCPNLQFLQESTIDSIVTFVKNGGSLFATHLTAAEGIDKSKLLDVLGVEILEPVPYSLGYLKLDKSISRGCPETALLVNDKFLKIKTSDGTRILANLVYPITETTPERYLRHDFSPPGKESPYPAITSSPYGQGQAVYSTAPIFRAFWNNNHWYLRELVRNIIALIQKQKLIEIDAPRNIELSLNRKGKSIVIHLLSYYNGRRTQEISLVDEFPVARDVVVRINKKLIEPLKIYTVPGKEELHWNTTDTDMIEFKVPEVRASQLVVLE